MLESAIDRLRLFSCQRARDPFRAGFGNVRALPVRAAGFAGGHRIDRRLLLLLDNAQARDILLVLLVIFREHMSAGAVGDEIELLGARRLGGRLERGAARIGNRRRRQAIDHIGVVRRRLLDFAAHDRASQRPFAADQTIDDGRIGLQLHLLLQAVDEDRSDARALLRPAGFLLNDGGKDDELLRRS